MNINNIKTLDLNFLDGTSSAIKDKTNKTSFKDFMVDSLNEVNKLQVDADNYKKMLAVGKIDNIHEVMIASEKADIALQFTMSIKNKVVDAYREITRMQI